MHRPTYAYTPSVNLYGESVGTGVGGLYVAGEEGAGGVAVPGHLHEAAAAEQARLHAPPLHADARRAGELEGGEGGGEREAGGGGGGGGEEEEAQEGGEGPAAALQRLRGQPRPAVQQPSLAFTPFQLSPNGQLN